MAISLVYNYPKVPVVKSWKRNFFFNYLADLFSFRLRFSDRPSVPVVSNNPSGHKPHTTFYVVSNQSLMFVTLWTLNLLGTFAREGHKRIKFEF